MPSTRYRLIKMEYFAEAKQILIDEPKLCASSNSKLVILIKSAPNHFDQRQLVRQTWARDVSKLKIPFAFVVARTLDITVHNRLIQEHNQHHDLIASHILDSWFNMTLKASFAIHWTTLRCKGHWMFWTDDDSIINAQNLVNALEPVIDGLQQ